LPNPLSSIVYSDVLGHLPVYLSTDLDSPKVCRSCYYYKRNFDEANLKRFISSIQQTDWDLDNCDFASFSETFTSIFDNCFPLEKYSVRKNSTPRKPWITKGLARSCAKKEKLYKTYIKNPSHGNTKKYKAYRNKLNTLIRTTEKKYYEEKFMEATDDMKKTWKIIKNIISRNKQNSLTESFVDNGKTITDKNAIVQKFNDFFVNTGPTLASKIQPTNTNHKEYLSEDYPDSFALFLTTPQEVIKATNELANKTSAGYDNISVNLIKKIIHHTTEPLSALINKSFEYGIVPDQLKIARVCPIFISGDQSDFTNYRPISVLPAFSKMFEKLVHTRLMNYLEKHSVLTENQFVIHVWQLLI